MTELSQSTLTDIQKVQMEMFYKSLSDAVNILGNNPTGQAQQTRIKIEEAMMWGRVAIALFQPAEPTPPNEGTDTPTTVQ